MYFPEGKEGRAMREKLKSARQALRDTLAVVACALIPMAVCEAVCVLLGVG